MSKECSTDLHHLEMQVAYATVSRDLKRRLELVKQAIAALERYGALVQSEGREE